MMEKSYWSVGSKTLLVLQPTVGFGIVPTVGNVWRSGFETIATRLQGHEPKHRYFLKIGFHTSFF